MAAPPLPGSFVRLEAGGDAGENGQVLDLAPDGRVVVMARRGVSVLLPSQVRFLASYDLPDGWPRLALVPYYELLRTVAADRPPPPSLVLLLMGTFGLAADDATGVVRAFMLFPKECFLLGVAWHAVGGMALP